MDNNLLLILLAMVLVAINGFFVAAEFGLVKLRSTRVKAIAKSHGLRGRTLAKLHKDLDAYLSACQLGITLASLGLGWIGEPAFARIIEPLLASAGIADPKWVHGIAFFIAFSTISFLHIVLGEQAPKSMAIRTAEAVALWIALPLYIFYWIMFPAIWLLNISSLVVVKLAGLDVKHRHEGQYSPEELKLILRGTRATEGYTRYEWRVLAQTLDFGDLTVSDLMRPFRDAVCLRQADGLAANMERIVRNRLSRYPYFDSHGKVLGIIHLKDIFIATYGNPNPIDLEKLIRPTQFVTPSTPATELLRSFRKGAPHFAVVAVDEDEPPMGFVTLDNLLGALVGEIRDEFRESRHDWYKMDDGTLLGKGTLPIVTLERALGVDINFESAETVAGMIMWKLGNIPKEGDKVVFEHFDAVVKKMQGTRVSLVRIYPHIDTESVTEH